jgi:hypothetical protein
MNGPSEKYNVVFFISLTISKICVEYLMVQIDLTIYGICLISFRSMDRYEQ